MKKVKPHILKILIEKTSLSPLDLEQLKQWENEGGNPNNKSDFINKVAPLKPGHIFEVKAGELSYEDGKLYYEAEIDLLALH